MKTRIKIICSVFVLSFVAALVGCTSDAPDAEPEIVQTAAETSVERGRYLVEVVGGCAVCHTGLDETGRPNIEEVYAGGLEVTDPAGSWRSLNITPDVETGIGGWTDEEIISAIREGKRPDGSGLVAVMPYMVYNALSDADAQAIVDYLRTIPPVNKTVERITDFPHVLAPPPSGVGPADGDAVARGEYIASIMHCVECHTPMGPEGPDHERAFAGGIPFPVAPVPGTGLVWSSNVTTHEGTGIAHYTEDDVITAIVELKKPDGSPILGPMNFYGDRWPKIENDDLVALARFVKSIPAVENHVPPTTFEPAQ